MTSLSAEVKPGKRVLTSGEEYSIAVYYVCGVPIKQICLYFDVHRMTVHRVLTRLGVEIDRKKKS